MTVWRGIYIIYIQKKNRNRLTQNQTKKAKNKNKHGLELDLGMLVLKEKKRKIRTGKETERNDKAVFKTIALLLNTHSNKVISTWQERCQL